MENEEKVIDEEQNEETVQKPKKAGKLYGWKVLALVAFVAFAAAIFGLGMLTNIMERKNEAKNPFFRVVELNDEISDPEVWGKNFPLQYDDYKKTVDQKRTKFGGSEAMPKAPSDADPRSIVSQSRLEEDPRLVTMWDGYAFAADFREERGHAFMLEDQLFTERQNFAKQPGSCINCHASVYTAYLKLGEGDIFKGFAEINKMPYMQAKQNVSHPVSCIDCHNPQTMALRVTRPAFMNGIAAFKKSQGIENYVVNRDATRQEMRSYVCGQCHVEYYFKGEGKELTYPWQNGLKVENMLAYYDEVKHKDWVHKQTGAEVLKAQHPEFELFSQGIHSRAGVSCSDCHMPYKREGAMKISDHHVRSPLLNISQSCQTCHKSSESELKFRAETIQQRTFDMRGIAMDALVQLIEDISKARQSGATDTELAAARDFQRKAQFYLDFVEAENSMGFHAPGEALRILGESVNFTRQGQLALRNIKSFKTIVAAH